MTPFVQGSQTLSVKGQLVSILVFSDYMVSVSLLTLAVLALTQP